MAMIMKSASVRNKLVDEQHRLCAPASKLKNICGMNLVPDAETLARIRWSLAGSLMQHLTNREHYIYSKLAEHPRAEVRAFFVDSRAELITRFAAYSEKIEKWTTARALRDWAIYAVNAGRVADQLIDFLQHQETELFPLLDRHGIDLSFRDPVTFD